MRPVYVQNRIDWLLARGRVAEAAALAVIEWESPFDTMLFEMAANIETLMTELGREFRPVLERMAAALDYLIMKE